MFKQSDTRCVHSIPSAPTLRTSPSAPSSAPPLQQLPLPALQILLASLSLTHGRVLVLASVLPVLYVLELPGRLEELRQGGGWKEEGGGRDGERVEAEEGEERAPYEWERATTGAFEGGVGEARGFVNAVGSERDGVEA